MDVSRRKALKSGSLATVYALAVSAGLIPASASAQWNDKAFEQKTLKDTASALGGSSFAETKDVNWGSTPEIAENGAVVPVSVTSNLPKTESISILVEKNPNALAAALRFPPAPTQR